MSEIIYLAKAHHHDEHCTYEASFRLVRLRPSMFTKDGEVVGHAMEKCEPEDAHDPACRYTYMSIPSFGRLQWDEETAELASEKLQSLGLKCFTVV